MQNPWYTTLDTCPECAAAQLDVGMGLPLAAQMSPSVLPGSLRLLQSKCKKIITGAKAQPKQHEVLMHSKSMH